MKNLLINTLSSLGYPVKLQGSIEKNEQYPESFFTFWENDSYDGSHYDNNPINYIHNFDVNFYSIDPTLVNTVLLEAKTELKKVGFIMTGKGYDVPSDEPTHTGRGMNALIIEKESE